MKKTFIILAIACVAMLMSSCKKEGAYNPSRKITKVYVQEDIAGDLSDPLNRSNLTVYTPKYLSESWTWKGNTLEKIDKYSQTGNIESTLTFTYDNKKRISRIDNASANDVNIYTEFTYEGKELSESKYYINNTLATTYKFTHENGKISKVEFTSTTSDIDKAMRFILPSSICQFIEQAQKEYNALKGAKGETSATVVFTWNKDNISNAVFTSGNWQTTNNIEYDNFKNPYYGMFESEFTWTNLCKNNPNITRMSSSSGGTSTILYQYNYDTHNYPEKVYSNTYGSMFVTETEYEYK